MAWVTLLIAGLCEIVGVIGINRWNRKKNIWSFGVLVGGFATSFIFLTLALQSISMSTAYAIWTAIGTVGGTFVGIVFYGESCSKLRIFFLMIVVISAIGLKIIN